MCHKQCLLYLIEIIDLLMRVDGKEHEWGGIEYTLFTNGTNLTKGRLKRFFAYWKYLNSALHFIQFLG